MSSTWFSNLLVRSDEFNLVQ